MISLVESSESKLDGMYSRKQTAPISIRHLVLVPHAADVRIQPHVITTQLQSSMMDLVCFLTDVPIRRLVTTTQLQHVMTGLVTSVLALVALTQPLVTIILRLPAMTDRVQLMMPVECAEALEL